MPEWRDVARGAPTAPCRSDNGCCKLIANYAFRQHVKLGLTGWAQIKGFRGETAKLELMEAL